MAEKPYKWEGTASTDSVRIFGASYKLEDKWFLADCAECEMRLPFQDDQECSAWAEAHREGTGHRVTLSTEWRLALEGKPPEEKP